MRRSWCRRALILAAVTAGLATLLPAALLYLERTSARWVAQTDADYPTLLPKEA